MHTSDRLDGSCEKLPRHHRQRILSDRDIQGLDFAVPDTPTRHTVLVERLIDRERIFHVEE